MKSLRFIFFVVFVTVFYSCSSSSKKSDPQPSPVTIINSWTLQKQHVILYDNKILIADTIVNKSDKTTATAQFNNDGSYKSVSSYYNNINGTLSGPYGMNLSGSYTYSNLTFGTVPVLAGWYGFYLISPPPADDTLQAQVTALTSSALTIHYNITGNHLVDNNNVVHNYVEQLDYYYIKP